MAGLPVVLPIPQEAAVASYNWTDLAEGTGIVQYYLVRARETTNDTYHIISQAIAGYGVKADRILTNGTYDFDLIVYNTPKVIRGNAVFAGEIYAASSGSINITITIKRVDVGDVETSISSAITSQTQTYGSAYLNSSVYLNIPLTTTNFKKGDKLRATVTVNEGASYAALGLDPTGEAVIYGTSTALQSPKLLIPYNIDI